MGAFFPIVANVHVHSHGRHRPWQSVVEGTLRALSLFMPRNTSMASSTPFAAGAARSLSTSRNYGA